MPFKREVDPHCWVSLTWMGDKLIRIAGFPQLGWVIVKKISSSAKKYNIMIRFGEDERSKDFQEFY